MVRSELTPQTVSGITGAVLAAVFAGVLFVAVALAVAEPRPPEPSQAPTAGLSVGIGVGVAGS